MSISFNGTSTQLVRSANLRNSYPFSIFAWAKPAALTADMWIAGQGMASGKELSARIAGTIAGDPVQAFTRDGAASTTAAAAAAAVTTWQPCLVVFTSITSRTVYYAGGAAVTTTTSNLAAPQDHTEFVVGRRPGFASGYFSGDIAEVAIWSTALDATAWAALAAGDAPETVSSGSLIDAWSLIDATTLTGVNGNVLTATSVSNGSTHPISRGGGAVDATAPGATLTGTAALESGTATGTGDGTASGATLTGTATLEVGTATGGSSGSFSFDPCENNTQSGVLDGIAVNWTWHTGLPGAVTAVTNGSGTLTSAGMSISGLPAGAGYGVLRTADGTVVAYQEGTVT